MRALIADDDPGVRLMLSKVLTGLGLQATCCANGHEVLFALEDHDPPALLLLDWLMPGADGAEICRKIRRTPRLATAYVIMLTAREGREALLEGFRSGADDYVAKPFDNDELQARIIAGVRIARVEQSLSTRIHDLHEALAKNESLGGLLPLCAWCRKVRDDDGYWKQVEEYVSEHTSARFTHGICEHCSEKMEEELTEQTEVAQPSGDGGEHCQCDDHSSVPKGGLQGDLGTMGVVEIAQLFHQTMRTGRLWLEKDTADLAQIYFKDGEVRQVSVEDQRGEDAFYDLMTWQNGRFSFDEGMTAPEPNVFRPAMSLLLEGARRRDEADRQSRDAVEHEPEDQPQCA